MTHHDKPAYWQELEASITYRPELNCLDQADPALAAALANLYLHPPAIAQYSYQRFAG